MGGDGWATMALLKTGLVGCIALAGRGRSSLSRVGSGMSLSREVPGDMSDNEGLLGCTRRGTEDST
jgi:hypothetical protein